MREWEGGERGGERNEGVGKGEIASVKRNKQRGDEGEGQRGREREEDGML